MKLVSNWRRVLRRAWSVRLMIFAALLSGAEVALPFMGEVIEPGRLALLSALSASCAFVARILAQKGKDNGT
jgi:hypothetical protein